MTDHLTSFQLFPELPTELRLKIWDHAIEPRILQLGVDGGAPYPFLDEYFLHHCDRFLARKPELRPIRTFSPSVFSICRESRERSRSQYLPFGYTFIHPQLDTLFISYEAARLFVKNAEILDNRACPPLYCTAMFDRVAIEYYFNQGRDVTLGGMNHQVLGIFTKFGPPKELLLCAQRTPFPPIGWKHIRLVDQGGDVDNSGKPHEDITKILDVLRQNHTGSSWLQWRVPMIKIVEVEKEGINRVSPETEMNTYTIGDNIAKRWESTNNATIGAGSTGTSIWHCLSNSYDKEHVEETLSKSGIQWRLEA